MRSRPIPELIFHLDPLDLLLELTTAAPVPYRTAAQALVPNSILGH
jgi:hypothetical protein